MVVVKWRVGFVYYLSSPRRSCKKVAGRRDGSVWGGSRNYNSNHLSPAGFPIRSPLAVARYSARDRKNRRFHISTGFSDRISTRIHTYVRTTEITKVLNGTPYPRCDLSCVFCPSIGGRSDKFPSCHDVNLAWPPTAISTTRTNAIISLFAHPYRHDEAN